MRSLCFCLILYVSARAVLYLNLISSLMYCLKLHLIVLLLLCSSAVLDCFDVFVVSFAQMLCLIVHNYCVNVIFFPFMCIQLLAMPRCRLSKRNEKYSLTDVCYC